MQLTIFDKFRPFSHAPGASYLLPGTTFVFTLYPALIKWHDLAVPEQNGEIPLRVTGPVKEFTSQLDLEKGVLHAWGQAQEGYYKYRITPESESFAIAALKGNALPFEGIAEEAKKPQPLTLERLHLGISKKQEWEQVHRRCDLKELLPFWYALSQQFPLTPCDDTAPSLYTTSKKLIEQNEIEAIGASLEVLYRAAFGGVLVPRLQDEGYQGFSLPPFIAASPLAILPAVGRLIRSLFIKEEPPFIHILPHLPVEFHSGRFIGLNMRNLGEIDIEWTKKTIRRLVFRCKQETELQFVFQKHLHRFCRRDLENGKKLRVACGTPMRFTAGNTYLLDNFEK